MPWSLQEANERTDASPAYENRNELLRSIVSDRYELERIQDKILIFPQTHICTEGTSLLTLNFVHFSIKLP